MYTNNFTTKLDNVKIIKLKYLMKYYFYYAKDI